ncbi:MAG: hypothetical protein JWN62_2333, partial [Acidimicrobiales bacterium]|nr:hypothetical protein [Acidimicrobiales bacterium]
MKPVPSPRSLADVVGVVLGLAAIVGLVGPRDVRGMGDNGDGARLFCGAGIAAPEGGTVFLGGVVLDFGTAPACPDPQPSSALAFLKIARHSGARFVLTQLGWIYAVAFGIVTSISVYAVTARRLRSALLLSPAVVP